MPMIASGAILLFSIATLILKLSFEILSEFNSSKISSLLKFISSLAKRAIRVMISFSSGSGANFLISANEPKFISFFLASRTISP